MSPERDFGSPHDDQPDEPEEDPHMHPHSDPDDQPGPDHALEAPQQPRDRFDVDTPSVGQLYAMFPDALPKNHPEHRRRHLAAVPDSRDVAALPAAEDADDPLLAAALRLRLAVVFWWRPTVTALAVVVIAISAFTAAGVVVALAWCVYGSGWIAHSVWHVHGRPTLRQLYRNRRGSTW